MQPQFERERPPERKSVLQLAASSGSDCAAERFRVHPLRFDGVGAPQKVFDGRERRIDELYRMAGNVGFSPPGQNFGGHDSGKSPAEEGPALVGTNVLFAGNGGKKG